MASLSLLAGMNPEHLRALGGWSARSEVWERYVKSVREDAAIKAALELDLSGRIFGAEFTDIPSVAEGCQDGGVH